MRRTLTLVATVSLAFTGSAQAVTLITPQGQLVGGQWQAWANDSKVPTASGLIVFEVPAAMGCATAGGCSLQAPTPGTSPIISASNRYTLYFELGHQFDWRYLTDANRSRIARFWGHPHWPWLDSARSLDHGSEDGLMADFDNAYAQCAQTGSFAGISWPSLLDPPNIDSFTVQLHPHRTCAMIRHFYSKLD
jgi:hypothetical protein